MSNSETVDYVVGRCISDHDMLELACDDSESCVMSIVGPGQVDPSVSRQVRTMARWLRDGGYRAFRAERPDTGVGSVI